MRTDGDTLTWTISPMTMTMATQDTMSAWFWMTNSWLSIGGFLAAADLRPLIGAILYICGRRWPRTTNGLQRVCTWTALRCLCTCYVVGGLARTTSGTMTGRTERCLARGSQSVRRKRVWQSPRWPFLQVAVGDVSRRVLLTGRYTCRRVMFTSRDRSTRSADNTNADNSGAAS